MPAAGVRTRVIGLGNRILSDDAVGICVARELRRLVGAGRAEVDIVESEVGGFDLLELLTGWPRIFLVDAVQFGGVAPGTILRLDVADLRTSLRLRGVHEIDLPTVLALGSRLGMAMPESLRIWAVQGGEMLRLSRQLTAPVAAAVPRVCAEILAELHQQHGRPRLEQEIGEEDQLRRDDQR